MERYCCLSMTKQFEVEFPDERYVCVSEFSGEFGLINRKNPTVYTPISYCPWCGARLPSSLQPEQPFSLEQTSSN